MTTPTTSGSTTHATSPAPAPNPGLATATVMIGCLQSVPPPAPPPDPEADKWATVINNTVRKGLVSFINTGIHLNNAKAALGHDRWLRMFSSLQIAMSERTAQMLMRIASHQALANANHVSELPPTLTALYALSGGSVEAVTAGIQSGDINPDMSAKAAKAFVSAQGGGPPPAKPAPNFDSDKRRNRVQQAVRKEAAKWPDDARWQFADLLEGLAKDIRASLPRTPQP